MRENAVCALAAAGVSGVIGWLGLYGFAWNDYETEAQPAFAALVHGHVLSFLQLAPAYGGSLVLRAPFALLPGLWGGGELAVYRMVALPCLLAGAALGVYLLADMRRRSGSLLARALVLGVCVANPLTLQALELGHPEELLGACLCVAAVLAAGRDKPMWAGVLLGVAIANKEWAIVAAGPVLLALPAPITDPGDRGRSRVHVLASAGRRHILCVASGVLATALVLAPLVLASRGGFALAARATAVTSGSLFQPWQMWWFFGWHGALVHRSGVPLYGYRIGPGWVQSVSHPLVVIVGLGLAGALWLKRSRRCKTDALSKRDALLLLALVMLLRCLLDTWDTGYYMLPCLIALLAWEAMGDLHRPPVAALLGIVAPWFGLAHLSANGASPDLQAALFLVWTLLLAAVLAGALYAPRALRSLSGRWGALTGQKGPGAGAWGQAQETTVNSLGSPVRTS